nr:D-3-phosphoglycerate dehydrogenase 1, chloroplastic-like [Tanacetum cinerariifolium]
IGFEDDLVLTRPTFTTEVLTELTQYATLAENPHKLATVRSSDKPLEIVKVQIADVESRLAGEIKVAGRVKDGVPHLMKVCVLDVALLNQVALIGVRMKEVALDLLLYVWLQESMKRQKEVPSATTWLMEPPMKIPSTSSVTSTDNNGRV